MSLIKVENVSKIFRRNPGPRLIREQIRNQLRKKRDNEFYALRDVSFSVDSREAVAVIGANGAGKSTLLGLIAGLAKPDRGRIEVNGRVAALLELGSGFHPDLTGKENVLLNASLLGYNEKETRERMGRIVDFESLSRCRRAGRH